MDPIKSRSQQAHLTEWRTHTELFNQSYFIEKTLKIIVNLYRVRHTCMITSNHDILIFILFNFLRKKVYYKENSNFFKYQVSFSLSTNRLKFNMLKMLKPKYVWKVLLDQIFRLFRYLHKSLLSLRFHLICYQNIWAIYVIPY